MTPIEKYRMVEQELARAKVAITIRNSFPEDVQRVLSCLHDHFLDESFDVNAIIACSGARKAGIYARFKYHVGMSIREYLEDRRMEMAMRLLQYDAFKIYDIAFSVGYASYRTFERAFRRHVGCSPRMHREKMSRENDGRK